MVRLSPAHFLVVAAFTVPVVVELRTVAGFFGIDLPLVALVLLEAALLAMLLVAYLFQETEQTEKGSSTR